MSFIDISGETFGRLTVITQASSHPVKWRCLCSCGNESIVATSKLTTGWTKSCGCLQKESASKLQTRHGECKRVNGKRSVPKEYESWSAAKDRCYNTNSPLYKYYGGRGIKMSDLWRNDFGLFLADMGPRPKGYTIERVNNDGDYAPDNCRWATRKEQANNRRTSNLVTHGSETLSVMEWSRRLGVRHQTLGKWIKKGMTLALIIEKLKEIDA